MDLSSAKGSEKGYFDANVEKIDHPFRISFGNNFPIYSKVVSLSRTDKSRIIALLFERDMFGKVVAC